jgi:hypothetical protein
MLAGYIWDRIATGSLFVNMVMNSSEWLLTSQRLYSMKLVDWLDSLVRWVGSQSVSSSASANYWPLKEFHMKSACYIQAFNLLICCSWGVEHSSPFGERWCQICPCALLSKISGNIWRILLCEFGAVREPSASRFFCIPPPQKKAHAARWISSVVCA